MLFLNFKAREEHLVSLVLVTPHANGDEQPVGTSSIQLCRSSDGSLQERSADSC